MSGCLFDTNVLLDIATAAPAWLGWSEKQFRLADLQGPILCALRNVPSSHNHIFDFDSCVQDSNIPLARMIFWPCESGEEPTSKQSSRIVAGLNPDV